MAKRKTNTQFVRSIMEHSAHGALMQAFVMQALTKYAEAVAEADAADFDSAFLHGAGWVGCARELRDALDEHFGIKRDVKADSPTLRLMLWYAAADAKGDWARYPSVQDAGEDITRREGPWYARELRTWIEYALQPSADMNCGQSPDAVY